MEWMKEDDVLINGKDYILYEGLNSSVLMGKFIETEEGYSEDELHFTRPGLYRYSTTDKAYKECHRYSFLEERLVSVDYLKENYPFTSSCNALIHDQNYLIELPDKSLQLAWYLTGDNSGEFNVKFEREGFYAWSDIEYKFTLVKHIVVRWLHIPLEKNRTKYESVKDFLEKYPRGLSDAQLLYAYDEEGTGRTWAIQLLEDPGEHIDVNYIYTVPGFYEFNDDGVLVYMDKQPTHVHY